MWKITLFIVCHIAHTLYFKESMQEGFSIVGTLNPSF